MAEPRVKGLAFRSVLASLGELRGESMVGRVLGRLPAADASALRLTIVATSWYPLALYRQLWEAIGQETGQGEALARAIGRDALRRDLNSVHRALLRLLSPSTVMSISSRFFGSYYDTGKLEASEHKGSSLKVSWSGCSGFSRLMWTELIGSTELMLELSGGKHVRLHQLEGGRDGDDFMVLIAHWVV